ncbi:hypothetical protein OWV82_016952 [Melia azedarach]|nr:hypothetical protein OWV82_019691 [Melia azedarach]KAJ4710829.1 hypothetical protein OWV82_016952 [Melia azedarach]
MMRGSDTRCRSRGFVWAAEFCRLSRLCGERRLACRSARKMVLRLQGLVVQRNVEASYGDCRNDFREVRRVGAGSCGQQRSAVDRTQVLETELDEGVKHSGGGGCHGPPRRKRGCCNAEAHQRTSSSTRAWMPCLPTLKRASRMVRAMNSAAGEQYPVS